MATYEVSKTISWGGTISDKSAAVMRMFGVTVERLTEGAIIHNCRLKIKQGDIVYITGPSGAGKSVLLRELAKVVPEHERVELDEIELPSDRSVIDCIEGDVLEGLGVLSVAGLNDVVCVLNQPANLSEGQRYRFRLAAALAAGKRFVLADEFCCELDRISAAVISYNIQKYAKRTGTVFILASSHEDVLGDLQPDVLVVKELSGETKVVYKSGDGD